MQVPLNDPAEYEGGQLVFATSTANNVGRLERPSREVGSVTVHDNGVVHGVTPLVAGVRYGLFLLRVPYAHGDDGDCRAAYGAAPSGLW